MSYIPEKGRKVYSGNLFDVYQWDQEMFDGSTEMFERVHRIPAGFVIPVVEDQILILHEEQPARPPFISLPGGRFDSFDEDPLEAAKRELLEETGLVSDDWEFWMEGAFRGTFAKEDYFYIARNCRKVAEPKNDPGEKIIPEYLSFEAFLDLSDNPKFRLQEVTIELLRMKLNPAYKEAFRKKLFG